MRVIINVANMSSAGGLSVGLGVIGSLMKKNYPDIHFDVVIPSKNLYPFNNSEQITFLEIPKFYRRFPGNLLLSAYLKSLTKKLKPDKIFSMGNIPIASSTPQLVMIHWPYLVYQDHPIWNSMSLKEKLVRKLKIRVILSRVKYAKVFTVQTDIMKQRLLKTIKVDKPIHVIPSSFAPLTEKESSFSLLKDQQIAPGSKLFLYLTRYYVHKNLEIFIPLAKLAKSKNKNYKFIVTISPSHGEGAKKFLQKIKEENLEDIIINVGPVKHEDLKKLYNDCDAFIMPSMLETVGLTYLEAMSEELPIFTSKLDFAKDVCKEAAFYFDPQNADDILNCIETAFANEMTIQSKISEGKKMSSTMLDWGKITDSYIQILRNI